MPFDTVSASTFIDRKFATLQETLAKTGRLSCQHPHARRRRPQLKRGTNCAMPYWPRGSMPRLCEDAVLRGPLPQSQRLEASQSAAALGGFASALDKSQPVKGHTETSRTADRPAKQKIYHPRSPKIARVYCQPTT